MPVYSGRVWRVLARLMSSTPVLVTDMLAARLRDASIRRLRRARTSNWRALPVRAKSAPSEASADSGGGGVSHVLTSYEISIESQLSATPLRFESKGGHKRGKDGWSGDLGSKLWREVRLLRELRPEGATGAPLASRAELFVAGPEPGTALRVGEPGSATAALEKKAAAAGAALVAGAPIPIALSRSSHVATLREALYAHALATMGDEFEVSRDGARGVILTAKPGTPRCDATLENGRVAASQQFSLRVEDSSPEDELGGSLQLVVTAGRELRSAMTVRQIMDDASTPNVPEGARVVALGGPHLFGTLAYSSGDATRDAANASIGAPRPELGGDSLLSYHRKRYPARVPLLRDADDGAAPVWLVPSWEKAGGKSRGKKPEAMAYPAELLAPVVGARAAGATDQGVSTGDPATLQRRVSEIRVALGEPFSPHAKLADRMRRLPPWAGEPSKRVGGVFDGPAIAPSIASIASASKPPRTLYVGADRASLAKEVESAMRAWNTAGRGASTQLDDAVVDAIVADVLASDAEPTPIEMETNELESLFRRARDSGYDAVVIHCGAEEGGTFEAAVRDAAARAGASRPRRCGPASGNHGAARLALELLSLPGRGGQATAWPGAATVRDTTFVGVAGEGRRAEARGVRGGRRRRDRVRESRRGCTPGRTGTAARWTTTRLATSPSLRTRKAPGGVSARDPSGSGPRGPSRSRRLPCASRSTAPGTRHRPVRHRPRSRGSSFTTRAGPIPISRARASRRARRGAPRASRLWTFSASPRRRLGGS